MKDKYYENKELGAYAYVGKESVEYGFFGGEEHILPLKLITEGYHYEKGGGLYRRLCEWVESLF